MFEEDDAEGRFRTQVIVSKPGEVNGSGLVWSLRLAPRERWEVRVDVVPSVDGEDAVQPKTAERRFDARLVDLVEQTIAAQYEAVAGIGDHRPRVDAHLRADAERTREDVALRMGPRFFG